MSFIIRNATVKDAAGIANVHVKTWQHAYRGQIPDDYLDALSVEKRAQGWKKALEKADSGVHAFVAEVDGEIVGWCTCGVSRDEDATSETGELHGIYIRPDYINKGLGSRLVDRALEALHEDGYVMATLWVLDTNVKARKFYKRMGWKEDGNTKDEPRDTFTLHEVRYAITL